MNFEVLVHREYQFRYRACVCDSSELFFGCEVEFSIVQKGGKRYADNVTPLGKGILDKPVKELPDRPGEQILK